MLIQHVACLLIVAMAFGTIGSIIRIGRMEERLKQALGYSAIVVVLSGLMVAFILGVI